MRRLTQSQPGRPKTTWEQTIVVDPSDLQLVANKSSLWRFIEEHADLESDTKATEAEQLSKVWHVAERPGTLTPTQLNIFHLHYGKQRFSLSELAKHLNITQNTVAKHLEAITKRLAKALGSPTTQAKLPARTEQA